MAGRELKNIVLAGLIAVSLPVTMPNAIAGNPSFDVPLHDPVYQYIAELPFPPRTAGISLSSRPFTEEQVRSLLVYARESGLCKDTAVNGAYLRRFQRAPDGRPLRTTPPLVSLDGWHTYAYPYFTTAFRTQDSSFSVNGFTPASVDSLSTAGEALNYTRWGGRLCSSIGRALFYFDGTIITEYSTLSTWEKANDPHRGINETPIMAEKNKPGHFMGTDAFVAYAKYSFPLLDVKAGSDRVSWGYGDTSGLLFSGQGSPFLQLKMDRSFGAMNYTFLIGKLTADTYAEKRVIYAKHIAWTPLPWLSAGFSDAVIAENRDFEPLYCMPFVPYYFSEHFLGDRDNRIMSFDASAAVRKACVLYGEFLIDDISNMLGMFTNKSWGDKWGGIFGVKVFNPVSLFPVSVLKGEIIQIEPWVYTTSARPGEHEMNYPVNFGGVLGNALGPHSRAVSLEFSWQAAGRSGGSFSVRQIWKGRGPGSSIFDTNGVTYDTVAGRIVEDRQCADKNYRFENYERNRTVLSADYFMDVTDWLRLEVSGVFAAERKPAAMSLYQAGITALLNY